MSNYLFCIVNRRPFTVHRNIRLTVNLHLYEPKCSSIEQLSHDQVKNHQRQFPLVIVCQSVADPLNIGALFRLADAMGVTAVYCCGESPVPPHRRIAKTSRSTHELDSVLPSARNGGYLA